MNYRKANTDDVGYLVELRKKQLIDEGSCCDNNIDNELEQYFFDGITNKTLVVWLAVKGESIIGTAGVCFFQYPPTFSNPTGKIAYITNVYTKNEYRKQGVATKLLEYVMKEVKNVGCKFARLHASEQGKRLYENIGFTDAEGFMNKKIT